MDLSGVPLLLEQCRISAKRLWKEHCSRAVAPPIPRESDPKAMEQERREMTVAYFDCFSGAAGDMIVASLIDAGADEQALREGLSSLAVAGYTLKIEKIRKQGFAATRFLVELDSTAPQPHRHLADVVEIIRSGNLPDRVRQNSIEVFERLAKAEAQVHGTTVDKVHFHEVGAVDAIVDVVGAMLALQTLGVERVVCSAIPVGSGTVKCAHGVMPIPAPATAELLRGVPLAETNETGELITPTGAAVLTTLAGDFGSLPAMSVSAIGYGAGTRDGAAVPNLLRVFLGEASDSDDADSVTVLETNLDDASGEIIGFTIERALQMGALDAYAVPIQMKKSRPGFVLTVICESADVSAMEAILFRETPTLGIRRRTMQRTKLKRRIETVDTAFGEIRIKVGQREAAITASPEYEDCKAAAIKHDAALREVIEAARAAWTKKAGPS